MTQEQFISHAQSAQKALRRFLVALCCGDSQLADDVAQEALIKAWLSCDGFRNPAKFNAWIYRIAYNTFLNKKRGERSTVSYDAAYDIADTARADEAFRYQDLYAALSMLSAKERTAVLLYYMEDYSIKEIAETTEVSQDAVKQHLSRGRKHLRLLMDSPKI